MRVVATVGELLEIDAGAKVPRGVSNNFSAPVRLIAFVGLPVLYIAYVLHYSVNVPWSIDDWSVMGVVAAAKHGNWALWNQYGDRRLVISRFLFMMLDQVDHLNERTAMLLSAVIFIASYALLLTLIRKHKAHLSVLLALLVGVVWFTPADFLNSLWSFQLSWFLVVFFFITMLYALSRGWLVLAVACAVAASLSDVQGFVVWPVAALLYLRRRELLIWLGAAAATCAVYFSHFSFANVQCTTAKCAISWQLRHPVYEAKAFLTVVGNIIPTGGYGQHQVVGLVIVALSAYVIGRKGLPAALASFGLLFDLLIAQARSGEGIPQMLSGQYMLPNIVLLVGLVVCRWPRPTWHLVALPVALLVAAQIVVGTSYGITNARQHYSAEILDARVLANKARLSPSRWQCEINADAFLWASPADELYYDSMILDAKRYDLSLYWHDGTKAFRAEGAPKVPKCSKA